MRTLAEIETQFAAREKLGEFDSFFMVGIGGAGMAPLARMLVSRGLNVRGVDQVDSPAIQHLRELGVSVEIGGRAQPPTACEALILTDAIDLNESEEVKTARMLGADVFRRSQLLGWLVRDKRVVAVTGTHGKTTTTGMLGMALKEAGLDPTVIIGADTPDFPLGMALGAGDFAIVEACEAYDSLRDLDPYAALVTNLEPDHMDFHGSWEGLQERVASFLSRVPEQGLIVCCSDDPGVEQLRGAMSLRASSTRTYGRKDGSSAHLWDMLPRLTILGEHNRLNAVGALRLCEALGIDLADAARGIAKFRGARRRLEIVRDEAIAVVDDYAHHPTEVRASIQALRERFPERRLVVAYQPHLYSRTADFLNEFASALSLADMVFLTDIYPARERPIPGVSAARIAEKLTCPTRYVPSRHLLAREVRAACQEGDVVVGMGAGNIDAFVPSFLQELDRQGPRRVVVVMGGDSAEREVSLLSGAAVSEALRSRGYVVSSLDVSERLLSGQSLADLTGPSRPDLAFLCVHGTHAEDGAIQGFFELLHIPYTGSGVQASALAMDKERTKAILATAGLPTPAGTVIRKGESFDVANLPCPAVVKPNAQGSTVGISFVDSLDLLSEAVARALQYDDRVLIEPWLRGMEISVPILGDRALPVVEIVPASGRYDFESKYARGATTEIVPARLSQAVTERAQQYALGAHRRLGCAGASRTDMIVVDEVPIILEINTLPGMTSTSLLPNSAAAAGIEFEDLCVWMVEEALQRHVLEP